MSNTFMPVDPALPDETEDAAPMPQPVIPRKKKASRSGGAILALAALVAIGGVAFAAGRFTAPAAAATTNGFPGRFQTGPNASAAPGGGFAGRVFGGGSVTLRGQVTAVDASSITIKLADGTSITVPVDSSTTYHQATAAVPSDVAVGSSVSVQPALANLQPGASPNPNRGAGQINFGPATDVTVVE